ncbi:MAG: Hsp20/alpha crystallin family protein [Isosphaeraceae bacterium]
MSTGHHSIPVVTGQPASEGAMNGLAATAERAPASRAPHAVFTPLIDIYESPEGLILEADLPGVVEGGISIQLEDNVLNLQARVETPIEGTTPLHEEYRVGDFQRSFILSDEVERSAITADYRNGVLRLTLPKAERAKTRRIEIRS